MFFNFFLLFRHFFLLIEFYCNFFNNFHIAYIFSDCLICWYLNLVGISSSATPQGFFAIFHGICHMISVILKCNFLSVPTSTFVLLLLCLCNDRCVDAFAAIQEYAVTKHVDI